MKKHDFILWLRNRLSDLPPAELDRVCGFYANAIDERMEDGVGEEAAVHAMGEPEALLREIRASLPEQYQTEPSFDTEPRDGVYAQRPPEQPHPAAPKRSAGKVIALVLAGIVAAAAGIVLPFAMFSARTVTYPEISWESYDWPGASVIDMTTDAFLQLDLDGIDRIVIRLDAGALSIFPTDDLALSANGTDDLTLSHHNEIAADGTETLVIEGKAPDSSIGNSCLWINLPRWNRPLAVEVDTGEVWLGELYAGQIDITTSTGQVNLTNLTASAIRTKVDTGTISGNDLHIMPQGSISLACGIGDIDLWLPGSAADYTVNASVDLGNLEAPVGGSGDISVDLSVDIGDLTLNFYE